MSHTFYARRFYKWYTIELNKYGDEDVKFEVLDFDLLDPSESVFGKIGSYTTAKRLYTFDNGFIEFPSANELVMRTDKMDGTCLLIVAGDRYVTSLRNTNDYGLSIKRLDKFDWATNILEFPDMQKVLAIRNDTLTDDYTKRTTTPTSLIVRIPENAKGTITIFEGDKNDGVVTVSFEIGKDSRRENVMEIEDGRFFFGDFERPKIDRQLND